MIEVANIQVAYYPHGKQNSLYVLLRCHEDKRTLVIAVSDSQGEAIRLELEHIKFPRPMTHDLFKNVLDAVGWALVRVEVCDLKPDPHDSDRGTFYARLVLAHGGTEVSVDARPSDAIALALRCSSRILVDEKVMDKVGIVIAVQTDAGQAKEKRQPTALEVLQQKLDAAIAEERYEDAASLRDQINVEQKTHREKTSN